MANTTINAGLKVEQWSNKFYLEYVRESRFYRYMSDKGDNVISVDKQLTGVAGDNVTFGLINDLSNSAVVGDDTLENNEENLGNQSDTVTVNQLRNAVAVGGMEQKRTLLQVLESARERLKKWIMAHLRDELIDRFQGANLDGVTKYVSDTEANKDAGLAANTDRFLFGALLSNRSGSDHSASLLNVDTTTGTFDEGIVSLLGRIAEKADPKITPLTISEDEERWVTFCGSDPYRDLKASLDSIHQNAAPRDMAENPIWRQGDLVYDSVIIRKIPEIASVGNDGASGAPIHTISFCGQQAICLAWGQLTRAIRNGPEGRDYGNIRAVGISEIRGTKLTVFNNVFHGMVHGYVAAAADA
jgi:N4-gp56 family major capsid protein